MRSERARRWATICAEAFERVYPGDMPEKCFVCPLCLKGGSVDSASATLEDAPIRSLGGSPISVTCRACNNRAGSLIERHTKADAHWPFTPDSAARPVRLKVADGIQANVQMSATGSRLEFNFDEKHNGPRESEAFRKYFSQGTPDNPARLEFDIAPKRAIDRRVSDLGWLKAGYMAMFAAFGYSVILSPNYAPIREQINDPDEDLISDFYLEVEANSDARSIFVLNRPEELDGCYAVQMGHRIVLMPFPFGPSDPYGYVRGLRAADEDENLQVGIRYSIPWPTEPVMQLDDGRFQWPLDVALERKD